MTVNQLIKELSEFPENLTVLSFSDNCETAGEIEAVSGFRITKIKSIDAGGEGERTSITHHPHDGEEKAPATDELVTVYCSNYSPMTVKMVIEELKQFPEHMQAGYYPGGFSFAYQCAVINTVKKVKCSKTKKNFHDMMDHTNYTEEVYIIDRLSGKHAILIYNNKVINRFIPMDV